MSTEPYIVITNGTTTITIADGSGGTTNYRMGRNDWAPNTAGLRTNPLSGRGIYEDVVESFALKVYGTTAANAMANLKTLGDLLQSADDWALGRSDAAVVFKYSPKGGTVSSTANPLQATILGRAPGDQSSGITLPVNFDDVGLVFYIQVQVKLERIGGWLHTTTTANNSGSNGSKVTVTSMGTLGRLGPTKIDITNMEPSGGNYNPNAIICLADTPSVSTWLVQIAANGGGTGAPWTSVGDSGRFAVNTNVLRYTPGGTTASTSGNVSTTVGANWNKIAVYLSVRNNSATTSFRVKINLGNALSSPPEIGIPANATNPKYYFAGVYSFPLSTGAGSGNITVTATASAASGTLDIDNIVLVEVGDKGNYVFQVTNWATASALSAGIDHRLLTRPYPTAGNTFAFDGDVFVFQKGANIDCVILATGGASTADRWRWESGGAAISNNIALTRYALYVTPE